MAVLFLHFSKKIEFFRIERDREVGEFLDSYARKWWEEHVVADKMPSPVSEEEIKRVYNTAIENKKLKCDQELLTLVQSYSEFNVKKDEAEKQLKKLKVAIQKVMQDSQELVGEDGTVLCTWKNDKDSVSITTDWSALANKYNIPQSEIDSTTISTTKKGARKFLMKSPEVISAYLNSEKKAS